MESRGRRVEEAEVHSVKPKHNSKQKQNDEENREKHCKQGYDIKTTKEGETVYLVERERENKAPLQKAAKNRERRTHNKERGMEAQGGYTSSQSRSTSRRH
jgi:hypothetical protein